MLSEEKVKHIARLARLGLDDNAVKKFSSQLRDILDYVDILNEVDVKGVEPTSQVTGLKNVMREDLAREWTSGKELLALSPLEKQNNQIKVKPVFARSESDAA